MLNALAGPLRAAIHSSARRAPSLPPLRPLHASSSALRKLPKKAADFEPEFEDEEEEDLFAVETTQVSSPASSSASSALNREIRESIWNIVQRGARPSSNISDTRRARHPIRGSALEQYVAACETREDLESLRAILRAWRVMGKRVNGSQAEMIIRRCLDTQSPELAAELVEDKLHYGITTMPDEIFFQLYAALLALPQPPSNIPPYYRSRRHSVALAHLVFRMRRKANRPTKTASGEEPAENAEDSAVGAELSEEDSAVEAAAEDVSTGEAVEEGPENGTAASETADGLSQKPSSGHLKSKQIQLPLHSPTTNDPITQHITDAEVGVVEICFAALEEKGGAWLDAGKRILSRRVWNQAVAERKSQSAELAA